MRAVIFLGNARRLVAFAEVGVVAMQGELVDGAEVLSLFFQPATKLSQIDLVAVDGVLRKAFLNIQHQQIILQDLFKAVHGRHCFWIGA